MKKFLSVIVVGAGLLFAGTADAQMKAGYISVDNMVGLMPETAKLDSLLERYQADSINPQYAQIVSLYQYKDSVYKDSLKTSAMIMEIKMDFQIYFQNMIANNNIYKDLYKFYFEQGIPSD